MTSLLLTGASGFIGKNLNEMLADDFKITAPSHAELDLNNSEKTNQFFKNKTFDVVIHAAGFGSLRHELNSEGVYEKNLNMFKNIANQSNFFKRMIFIGSGAEYGKQRDIIRVKESEFGKVLPVDEYGRAKYEVSEYIQLHENIVNLRCFGVFGKYENYATRFISNSICRALSDKPIVVNQNAIYDFIYIKDLAKIVAHFAKAEPKEKFYNSGRGEAVELLALAEIIKGITKSPYPILVKNSGMGKEYSCNNSLLIGEIGNFKFTPITQAIKEMVEWYKNNQAAIDLKKLDSN